MSSGRNLRRTSSCVTIVTTTRICGAPIRLPWPISSRPCLVPRLREISIRPARCYPGQQRIRMRVGGQTVLIAPAHPNGATGAAPTFPHYGLEHMGLTVDNVDAACAELKAKGADVAIGPLSRSPGLRLAFIRGPEGIMVELVQR